MELILSTYGTSLTRENECFVISRTETKQLIAAKDISNIQLSPGIMVSSDAIFLAIEYEIRVIYVARNGYPKGITWSPRYGSISTISKGQLEFCDSTHAAIWIKGEIQQKVSNQQALLLSLNQQYKRVPRLVIDKAVERLEDLKAKIVNLEGDLTQITASLRGLEGNSSRIYFEALGHLLPDRYSFDSRSQHPAHDVVNAFLNYGYGVMYGRIEGALIKAGIDPYIGIMHRDQYNRPVLVYDVIERYRVWVDDVVCQIFLSLDVDEDYYSVNEDGTCWLEQQGRRVLLQTLNDYLEDSISNGSLNRTRQVQIQLTANELANTFYNYYKQR